ncbi:MAG: bacillithiol biosynthesis cysteine-adding enzyme BshC [Saprospiraceae bacterium]|nr:bacillithiol biosynthesis cysteine-adding enzyme BshC [Saprospiraceae bacterium]
MQTVHFDIEYLEPNSSIGFGPLDLSYWKTPKEFSPLLSAIPLISNIEKQIENRKDFKFRNKITEILLKQYAGINHSTKVIEQIEKLKLKNTFTVICAHQPCLLGGPLFWVYKIASTIKLAKILQLKYPEYNFIPIYYAGNEDHDFDEINHLNLFQHKIVWQEQPGIATGRLGLGQYHSVLDQVENLFQRNEFATQFFNKNKAWLNICSNYADYYRLFVDALFGSEGLVYFNPDDEDAKALFSGIIEKEIRERFIYENAIKSSLFFESLKFPLQVNPRTLNLFYHHPSGRKRIAIEAGYFHLIDTDIKWTESEILNELKQNPLNFSPNVLMRPLYQEFLFPNVAFVGGGGEIAYWMQLKNCFQEVDIPYPLLFRRLSAFHFDQSLLSKIAKTIYKPIDFLLPINELEVGFIKLQKDSHTLNEEDLSNTKLLLEKIKISCSNLDSSTKISIEAELQKIYKSLEHIETKHTKSIKQKHEQEIQSIRKIKEVLFPENSIQERHFNFLSYYLNFGQKYLDMLMDTYQPDLAQFAIIKEIK